MKRQKAKKMANSIFANPLAGRPFDDEFAGEKK
jgi:hypothetical protein